MDTAPSQETQSQRSLRLMMMIVYSILNGSYDLILSDVIDTWVVPVCRKRFRVSKDGNSTMAEDSDDPYDFTEDENGQIYLLQLYNFTLLFTIYTQHILFAKS